MNTQTPSSDHEETLGIVFFAHMLDKIRLRGKGPENEEILRACFQHRPLAE